MSIDPGRRGEEGEGTSGGEPLEDLRKCQRDIVSMRHRCDRQIDEIEKSFAEGARPYLERRNALSQLVPRFWSRSILNHPLVSTVFEPGESDVLRYLSNLEIDDDPKNPDRFKIHFSFRKNPYFENRTLTKEFTEAGSINSLVRWRKGQAFPKVTKHDLWEDDDLGLECKGFFRWFFDPDEHYCDPMADILKTCIWYNPLEYFDREPFPEDLATAPEPDLSGGEKVPRKVKTRSSRSENRNREEPLLQK